MNGKDLIVYLGASPTAIAGAVSCDVYSEGDVIEKSSPTSGQWREYESYRNEWSVGVSVLVLESADVLQLLNVGTTYQLKFKKSSAADSSAVTGSAILTQCRITGNTGQLAKGSFVFQGTGPLSRASNS